MDQSVDWSLAQIADGNNLSHDALGETILPLAYHHPLNRQLPVHFQRLDEAVGHALQMSP
ncbi:hypothetical protein D3C75_1060340 [compost metagenome]